MVVVSDGIGGFTEALANGAVKATLEPVGGGEVKLTVRHNGTVVESGEYPYPGVFCKPTPRGQFLNSVESSLESRNGIDENETRRELKEWLSELNELGKEEQKNLLPDDVRQIIDGTRTPVEIYDGEPTVWKVTLDYAGRERDLEFTAGEMIAGGGGPLQEKIANRFFELVDITEEDWVAIRDHWHEHSEVAHISDETTSDAIADRVLEYMRHNLMPVGEREKLCNDVAAVWYDESNSASYADVAPDEPIAWVQDSFYVDQIEAAGKQIEYKGQLTKDLIARGDLHGKKVRRRWKDGTDERVKVYPFNPEVLGIDGESLGGDEPAHSEVDA